MLVDDIASEVTGVLSVSAHNTVLAHWLVALLAKQPQLLCGMGRAEERLPSLAAIFAVLQLRHGVRGCLLLSPRREQPHITLCMLDMKRKHQCEFLPPFSTEIHSA